MDTTIKVQLKEDGQSVHIVGTVADPDVYRFIDSVDEADRGEAVARALKLGAVAMQQAHSAGQLHFVEKEFTRMKDEIDRQLTEYFGESGLVAQELQRAFGDDGKLHDKIHHFFGDDGKFEQLVADFVGEDGKLATVLSSSVGEDGSFHRKLEGFLGEKGELRQALDREFGKDSGRIYSLLNPDDKTTPLGKFRADLEDGFDPDKEGSALWKLKEQIREAFSEIKQGLGIAEATESQRQKGTGKGRDFEAAAFDVVERLSAPLGDIAEHMGDDPGPIGDVGDIVVKINPEMVNGLDRAIVLEVKNKAVSQKGKASIYKELDRGMQNRNAEFGIAIVEARHAEMFGPFRFAAPNYIIVQLDEQDLDILPLACALQLARALIAARTARSETKLDFDRLQGHVAAIESQMETVQAMKTNLTGAETNIGNVKSALDALRENVRDALKEILNSIADGEASAETSDG